MRGSFPIIKQPAKPIKLSTVPGSLLNEFEVGLWGIIWKLLLFPEWFRFVWKALITRRREKTEDGGARVEKSDFSDKLLPRAHCWWRGLSLF
jgi:hypothetical protein